MTKKVLENDAEDPHTSPKTTSSLILCYIQICQDLNEPLPYHDVKGFMTSKGFSTADFENFEKQRTEEISMSSNHIEYTTVFEAKTDVIDIEKLKYLLYFIDFELECFADSVLDGEKENAPCIAIELDYYVKCFIQVNKDIGEKLPYSNVEGYFINSKYPKDFIKKFKKIWLAELE